MALVYGDEPRTGNGPTKPISAWGRDAVMGAWQRHVENRAFLAFMYAHGNVTEKMQAAAELRIAERKITFWERHPEFDRAESHTILARLREAWKKK